nr:RnfABCDGE type electron transport complex subunit D [Acetitomaculum ruminis]
MLNVSSAPHVRSKDSTTSIMRDVLIALAPATLFGLYNNYRYGLLVNAIILLIVCIGVCVLSEYVWQKAMKKPITIADLSAAVTGLIIFVNLPAGLPWWIAAIGSVFSIIVVKQLYGGLGQNFMNPALGARCFMMLSFTAYMTSFPAEIDAVSTATPLTAMRAGDSVDLLRMFIGTTSGTIGETSVIAVLLGGAYLLARKVISIRIPGTYILTFAIFIFLFGGFDVNYTLEMLCGGGLVIGAFFMATDYVTSPITKSGQLIYGVCLGVLTGIFRLWGGSAEGVSYAIIICNLFIPIIERFTIPNAFGVEKEAK